MLGSSTLFRHSPLRWSNYRWFLRRLDHAAIFLFIAGTYTPFTVGQMGGEWVGPTVAVWAGALIGAAYKLAFPVGLRRPSLVAFAALASFVLFGLRPTLVSMAPPAVGLILAGVALYMVGAAIHHHSSLEGNGFEPLVPRYRGHGGSSQASPPPSPRMKRFSLSTAIVAAPCAMIAGW
jgi:channel protein (hemolysin III family)